MLAILGLITLSILPGIFLGRMATWIDREKLMPLFGVMIAYSIGAAQMCLLDILKPAPSPPPSPITSAGSSSAPASSSARPSSPVP